MHLHVTVAMLSHDADRGPLSASCENRAAAHRPLSDRASAHQLSALGAAANLKLNLGNCIAPPLGSFEKHAMQEEIHR